VGLNNGIEESCSTRNYVAYLHTETMRGWCVDIFHVNCYMIVLTCLYLLVLCSLLLYSEPRPVLQDVPVVGLTARCTGRGSPKYDLCMWFRARYQLTYFYMGCHVAPWFLIPVFLARLLSVYRGWNVSLSILRTGCNKWFASCYSGVWSQPKSLYPQCTTWQGLWI
jgi:hypothetical protein